MNWESKPLLELLSLIIDFRGRTPKKIGMSWGDGDIPALSANNVEMGRINLSKETYYGSEKLYQKWMTGGATRKGDVVLTTEAPLGNVAQIPDQRPYLLSQRTVLLRAKEEELENNYLYHYLMSEVFQNLMLQQSSGTTATGIQRAKLEKLPIKFPRSKTEQTKIAEVLSTVDQAIEQTEALIAKQQRIKTGLMQDLLTRGIDEHGNLRSEQTHEFKDSPLGRIPVEWEVKRLDDLLVEKRYGISTSLSEEPIGTPVLRMNNLMNGEIDYSNLKYSTREDARKLTLNEGDVLFNRTNSIDYVGRTGIYRNLDQRISFASYLVRLVTDSTRLHPEYLNLLLNDRANQIRVKHFATIGVQQANVNPTNLGTLNIGLPNDVTEQDKIIEAISTSRNCIHDIDANFRKLCSLKTGLMQGLLTGKKRVTMLLNKEVIG